MFPDAKWLDALQLPTKLKLAILFACGALFYLFKAKQLSFGSIDPAVTTGLLIALVVFGALVIADAIAFFGKPLTEKHHISMLAARRSLREKEREAEAAKRRAIILESLDHLSREEMRFVADALEKGTPTFYTYVFSAPVGIMQGKGLVWTTGGTHNQDHYPYSFQDFVWTALLSRREDFLGKEQSFKAAEEAAKAAERSRRYR